MGRHSALSMTAPSSITGTPPAAAEFDIALVRKYNVPGPRYTSYPTALQFTEATPAGELVAAIRRDNEDARRRLSLYFHLPFCETLCWFCGCTTVITLKQDAASDYVGCLEKELALVRPWLNADRRVAQMHFGGGTPTFLAPAVIRRLGEAIHSRFRFAGDSENCVEVDPRRITRDHVRAFRELGCDRASLGVQDTNPEVQRAIHRLQPMDITRQAFDWMRDEGYRSISVDLIFGLPHQTADSFARTIDEVLGAAARPPGRLQLRPCSLDQAVAADLREAGESPLHRGKADAARDGGAKTDGSRNGVHRDGPFRPGRRRAGRRPARGHVAAQFPGLQHACWGLDLRVRHVVDLADRRFLPPESEGVAGIQRGAGCRPPAASSAASS